MTFVDLASKISLHGINKVAYIPEQGRSEVGEAKVCGLGRRRTTGRREAGKREERRKWRLPWVSIKQKTKQNHMAGRNLL